MPRAAGLLALLILTAALSGCLGGGGGARGAAGSRAIEPAGGDVRIVDAQEAVTYDFAAQAVRVRVEGRALADRALDAVLGVYVAEGPCPPRGATSRGAPEAPLAQESFVFPGANAELRVHATLQGGPVLPGDEVHVVWLGDAANGLGVAYRCAAYRLSPLSPPAPPPDLHASPAVPP